MQLQQCTPSMESIIPTLTLSRITSGPATPETVLYSASTYSNKGPHQAKEGDCLDENEEGGFYHN